MARRTPAKKTQGNMSNSDRAKEQQHLQTIQRWTQALELRRAGATYAQIAQTLGYANPSSAQKAVESALKEALVEPAEGVLQLELARLDAMLSTLWPKMREGDYGAVDRILRIMDRRARFLGLDAPEKHEIAASIHGEVEHHHVVIIGGDEAEYMAALEDAVKQHEAQHQYELANPNAAQEIEDAEVVDDDIQHVAIDDEPPTPFVAHEQEVS